MQFQLQILEFHKQLHLNIPLAISFFYFVAKVTDDKCYMLKDTLLRIVQKKNQIILMQCFKRTFIVIFIFVVMFP